MTKTWWETHGSKCKGDCTRGTATGDNKADIVGNQIDYITTNKRNRNVNSSRNA